MATHHALIKMDTVPDGRGGYQYRKVGEASVPGDWERVPTSAACRLVFHEGETTRAINYRGLPADTLSDQITVAMVLDEMFGKPHTHSRMMAEMFVGWMYPKEGAHAVSFDRRPEDWPPLQSNGKKAPYETEAQWQARAALCEEGRAWVASLSKPGEMRGRAARRIMRELAAAIKPVVRGTMPESPRPCDED